MRYLSIMPLLKMFISFSMLKEPHRVAVVWPQLPSSSAYIFFSVPGTPRLPSSTLSSDVLPLGLCTSVPPTQNIVSSQVLFYPIYFPFSCSSLNSQLLWNVTQTKSKRPFMVSAYGCKCPSFVGLLWLPQAVWLFDWIMSFSIVQLTRGKGLAIFASLAVLFLFGSGYSISYMLNKSWATDLYHPLAHSLYPVWSLRQAEANRSVSCPVDPIDELCFPTGVLTHYHLHSALWSSEKISNGFNAEDFGQSFSW